MSIIFRSALATFAIAFELTVGTVLAQSPELRRPKKLIEVGWDYPDTQRLRANLEIMEQQPFDGVVIEPIGRNDQGAPVVFKQAFSNEKWHRRWFQSCVDDLKTCKFKRFTDNFLRFEANPGNVDLFDDDGWRNIVEHCGIAAWMVREGGVKGIAWDPEFYAPPAKQFCYDAQPKHDKHTYEEYCAQARKRGREMMQAIAAEQPNITILCYWLNNFSQKQVGNIDPHPIVRQEGFDLYPAFVDGWLDAVPPTIRIVDGCEAAYLFNGQQDFLEASALVKGPCQALFSPENRAKYRAQVEVGFAFYLDAYWNPKEPKSLPYYLDDGRGGSRVDLLRTNLVTALRLSDEYVWVYGEKFRWWPTPNDRVGSKSWPETLPGCEQVLRIARDPLEYMRTAYQRKRAEKAMNLAVNGDFTAETATLFNGSRETWLPGKPPAGWQDTWQGDESHGTLTWDRQEGAGKKGAARAAAVQRGCFIQVHSAKAGEYYVLRAVGRLQGQGKAALTVRWQDQQGRWLDEGWIKTMMCDGPRGEWAEMIGMVRVPNGTATLLLMLSVNGQHSPDDVAWFDDVELYKIWEP